VLGWYPRPRAVFRRHGFTALDNAALRRTLARHVTVAQAAALRRADLPALLRELNATVSGPAAALQVISLDEPACTKGGPR
jgi:hypothetical protein